MEDTQRLVIAKEDRRTDDWDGMKELEQNDPELAAQWFAQSPEKVSHEMWMGWAHKKKAWSELNGLG